MIEAKMQEPIIYHGNLDSVRDYTDARDVVEAFWLATECCEPGVPYNICTGEAISIGKLLDDIASLSTVIVRKQPDPARMRPSDVLLLIGDSTKFRDKTGWKPRIPFKQTMSDLLEAWRDRLRK
jgi:GDP-4-dehydro-6-deoxy-D-mannose reductase